MTETEMADLKVALETVRRLNRFAFARSVFTPVADLAATQEFNAAMKRIEELGGWPT